MKPTSYLQAALLGMSMTLSAPVLARASFQVAPVKLDLIKSVDTTLLAIRNIGDHAVRLEVTVHKWSQDPAGAMQLAATDEIVFFPKLLTLSPGEERSVRVGMNAKRGPVEKAYRIIVEELPSAPGEAKPGAGTTISFRTKMNVPIFVKPASEKVGVNVQVAEVHDGILQFDIHNTGTNHFVVQSVVITGETADATPVLKGKLDGWYVLPGEPRSYRLRLPSAKCADIHQLTVEAETSVGTFKKTIAPRAGACGN